MEKRVRDDWSGLLIFIALMTPLVVIVGTILIGFGLFVLKLMMAATWSEIAYGVFLVWLSLSIVVIYIIGMSNER